YHPRPPPKALGSGRTQISTETPAGDCGANWWAGFGAVACLGVGSVVEKRNAGVVETAGALTIILVVVGIGWSHSEREALAKQGQRLYRGGTPGGSPWQRKNFPMECGNVAKSTTPDSGQADSSIESGYRPT